MVPAGSRRITRVPRYSGVRYGSPRFAYGIVTLCDVPFQTLPLALAVRHRGPTTPLRPEPQRFGLFPGRSPLLGESLNYFLFLQVLRCFSSLRSPPHIRVDDRHSGGRVVPFGNRRITGHLHLPDAYRSLSRPSSPPRAKASAVRPSILSRSVAALLRLRLILSAVFSVPAACCQAAGTAFCLYVLQSCLCQYVKDLMKVKS